MTAGARYGKGGHLERMADYRVRNDQDLLNSVHV
jgi:hypothetical protein